ncbi:MAG: flagellar hook-length control protein FliK [bacterium]|nr:flagellar hook-length control protein FliK [bacterium]
MTTTLSIDLSLPSVAAKPLTSEVALPVAEGGVTPQKGFAQEGAPQTTVLAFQSALERPFAENAALQQALEDVVGNLSRTAFTSVENRAVETTSVAQNVETPKMTVDQPRSTEAVTRQPAAPTVAVVESSVVLPQVQTPIVDATVNRVTEAPIVQPEVAPLVEESVQVHPVEVLTRQPAVPTVAVVESPVVDEVELSDAVVAAGVHPAVEGSVVVAPLEHGDKSNGVTAVDSVKAAFAPVEVLPTETFFEVANAVADTLLVSPGLLRGEGEVRVQLRPDVLEGSEIRIAVTGRQLAVDFIPQTQDVAVLIEQNRPQLEQHLAARIQTFTLSVGVHRRRSFETRGSAT